MAPLPEPTPSLIEDALGDAYPAWERLVEQFAGAGVEVAWHYYRDGGWLAKATQRKKTAAWLQVNDGFTRVTFYLPSRLRQALVETSDLSQERRRQLADQEPYVKSLVLTFELRTHDDLDDIAAATRFKLTAK